MRTHFLLIAVGLLTLQPSVLHAQGLGYAMAGPAGYTGWFGTRSGSVHAAGGGEVLIDRIGVGGEVGTFQSLITISVNGTVHLASKAGHRVPFITAGYSKMGISYGEGSFPAFNVGGGIDIWSKRRAGARIELRDHIRGDFRGRVHYWSARAGVVFR